MNKVLKMALIAITAASLVLGLAGCGGSSPTAAAKAFMEAAQKGDAKAMEKVATKDTTQLMGMFGEKISDSLKDYGKITNTTEKIEGDKATVSLTFENGKTEEITLIKENGKWLVNISK
jgi:ABC-type glycerol-3-phosphate transport system substrate-binding protein